mmetsp:Transcript_23846/g.71208  ORF Transcript_23846/g.71208 Transcript_23846/m.71208 type:complete len:215 (+) Transcript_23846:162-806(+)
MVGQLGVRSPSGARACSTAVPAALPRAGAPRASGLAEGVAGLLAALPRSRWSRAGFRPHGQSRPRGGFLSRGADLRSRRGGGRGTPRGADLGGRMALNGIQVGLRSRRRRGRRGLVREDLEGVADRSDGAAGAHHQRPQPDLAGAPLFAVELPDRQGAHPPVARGAQQQILDADQRHGGQLRVQLGKGQELVYGRCTLGHLRQLKSPHDRFRGN